MNAARKLDKVKVRMMQDKRHAFFVSLLMKLGEEFRTTVERAATDWKTLLWNEEWVKETDVSLLQDVSVHEVMHVVQMHHQQLQIAKARHPMLSLEDHNICMDFEINSLMVKWGFGPAIGNIGVMPDKHPFDFPRDLTYLQYAKLVAGKAEKEEEEGQSTCKEDGSPGEDNGSTGRGNGSTGRGNGSTGRGNDSPGEGNDSPGEDDGSPGEGEGPAPGHCVATQDYIDNSPSQVTASQAGGEDEIEEHRSFVEQAVASAVCDARSRGELPGAMEQDLGKATVRRKNWKEILRDHMEMARGSDYATFNRLNKRYADIKMPTMQSEGIDSIALLNDTSGSCYCEEADMAWEFIAGLREEMEFHATVIQHDSRVTSIQECDPCEGIDRKKHGGGGTCHVEALERAQDCDPNVIIAFTDLETRFPQEPPSIPVVWVVFGRHVNPPFGEVVLIEKE